MDRVRTIWGSPSALCGPTGLEIAIRDALDIMAMGFSQKFQNQVVKLLVINYH